MAGEEAARIFYASGTFAGGFEEVAHLTGDVAEGGHEKKVVERDFDPEGEGVGDEERAEHAANGTLPGFFGGDVGGERMFADGAADEVGGGVCGPGDDEGKEENLAAINWDPMHGYGERERKGNEKKSARGNTCGRQRFDERAAGPEGETGDSQNKEEEGRGRRSHCSLDKPVA